MSCLMRHIALATSLVIKASCPISYWLINTRGTCANLYNVISVVQQRDVSYPTGPAKVKQGSENKCRKPCICWDCNPRGAAKAAHAAQNKTAQRRRKGP